MSADGFDNCYRKGDAITFLLKHRPYIDLGLPPSANDYRDATCVTLAIYDQNLRETLLEAVDMTRVPNRPGWYFYRYQTGRHMAEGVYTAIITAITTIDGTPLSSRNVQEFRLLDDGIV